MSSQATRQPAADRLLDQRSLAQWFCLTVGATLVLVGLVGFIADSSFSTGSPDGSDLIIFEVNGWHNVVHILTGGLLLATAGTRALARTGVLVFTGGYLVVSIIGLIDGHDVLGLFPIDPADNVLHIVLALAGLGAFALSGPGEARTAGAR